MTRDSCGTLTTGSCLRVCTSPKALLRYLRSLHCRLFPLYILRPSCVHGHVDPGCCCNPEELGSEWAKGQGPHHAGFGGLSLEQCWFWLRQLQWGKPREPVGVEQRRGKLKKAAKRRMKRPGTQRAPRGRGADAWRCWGLAWHRGES